MITRELLKQVVAQQKLFPIVTDLVPREILREVLAEFKDNRIIILTGIRRCGKSTLLKQVMIKKKDHCYVNFEDERFLDFKAQDFELLNEALIEIYGNPDIYFFDEIQNIEKFETFVRRLQDQGKKVVLTGSNATLLSRELGTRLTGRYKSFEVYPFSFREFLDFMHVRASKESFYVAEEKVNIVRLFEEYMLNGGFPEYVRNKDKEYIKTVYENIIYRDVIARYAIKKQRVLKELISILTTNIASTMTYNALRNQLGLANAITVKEYIAYLANTYLFFEVQKFDFSLRKQLGAPKKVYLIDPAINLVTGLNFSPNKGRILENIVFIELKRTKKEVFYFVNENECDFVIKEGNKITEAIHVCYLLNDKNREREIGGLSDAMDTFKLRNGIVLTSEQEEEVQLNHKKIKIIPAWKWLLRRQ